MNRRAIRLFAVCGATLLCGQLHAQWTVTSLHPPSATWDPNSRSSARGVGGSQQVGQVRLYSGGPTHASLWSSTGASWVSLDPGYGLSDAIATSGTQQVGYVSIASRAHASLWSGSAASWVDLHPAGALSSYARDIAGTQQAGYANIGGHDHASVWSGTAASWVDLHPAGATISGVEATTGLTQTGFASIGGYNHAALWSGTAASWVDLHPAGALVSYAYGMWGSQQVGQANFGSTHASLWSGTSASWVDLNPAGAASSTAYDNWGSFQVGNAIVGGIGKASLWNGSAGSWEDLSLSLPPGTWGATVAHDVWSDGSALFVAGWGVNMDTMPSRTEALLWSRPIPAPGTLALLGLGGLTSCRRRH